LKNGLLEQERGEREKESLGPFDAEDDALLSSEMLSCGLLSPFYSLWLQADRRSSAVC
jgi:hypothetical protein